MNKIIKYSFVTMFSLVLAIGFSFGLSQVTAQPAYAEVSCGGISSCKITITNDWNGEANTGGAIGGGPGGGSTGGGGSTSVKPSPPPQVCNLGAHYTVREDEPLPAINGGWRLMNATCIPKYQAKTKFHKPGSGYYCSPSTSNGIIRQSTGTVQVDLYIAKVLKRYNHESGITTRSYYGYQHIKTTNTCVYPDVKAVATNKYCAISANGALNRLAKSRLGPAKIQSFKASVATVDGLKKGTATCKQSVNMSFASGLSNTEKNWGQYKLSGKISYVRCTEYKVSFDGKSTRHFSCGSLQTTPAVVAHVTLWCGGAKTGLLTKTWTMNDCYNGPKGGYTCTVPKATFDGKTGTVQTIRDGKSRVLNWGAPDTGSSVRNTTGWEQTVTIDKGSSPRNTGVSDNNKASQYFWSNSAFGTSWNKSRNVQSMAFYNASNPGGAFKATRKLRFDGQFRTIATDITSYNPWTGKMGTKNRTVWVKDYNIKCQTAVSPRIQAIRSIGDVQ